MVRILLLLAWVLCSHRATAQLEKHFADRHARIAELHKAGEYTVTVTDQNGCTASVTVEVDLMVGTKEAEGQALLIYPNPTADWVQVVLPARQGLAGGPENMGKAQLELSDASGRVLRSAEASAGVFDLRGLPSGSYVLRVRDVVGKVVFVGKVVKR